MGGSLAVYRRPGPSSGEGLRLGSVSFRRSGQFPASGERPVGTAGGQIRGQDLFPLPVLSLRARSSSGTFERGPDRTLGALPLRLREAFGDAAHTLARFLGD